MSLNSSDSRWLKPAVFGLLFFAILGVWAYLGGGIFMMAHHRQFEEATPLTLYQYWVYYGQEPLVMRWIYISAGAALVIMLAPGALFFAPAKRSLFGDARFAKAREIRDAGLLGTKGIIVGLYMSKYLMFGGSQHVIMSAPTRSGKGVGVVIPNLLTWPDSMVVLDIKQENHAITSGYRQRHGQPCYLFNPVATDYRTHRYNPLAYISDDANFRIDDIQKIANMLFPDVPGTDVIWTATPRSFFLGVVLFLMETPGKLVTLGQVLRESLADGDGSKYFASIINMRELGERIPKAPASEALSLADKHVRTLLADKAKAIDSNPILSDMAVWSHLSGAYRKRIQRRAAVLKRRDKKAPDILAAVQGAVFDRESVEMRRALSPSCVRALNTYITITSENTRAGIITSFRSRLELWNNPLVDAATSANDFDLRDVRKKRMTIFLGVTPDNLDRMAMLLNLFWQQLIDLNTRVLPEHDESLKYQVLLMPDEFTAMGKIQVISKGISFIAGYGLRLLPIIQSPAQVVEVYGKEAAQTFTTNHALQIVFPPKASELQTAKDISEWLGYQTVKNTSESRGKAMFSKREKSESQSDTRRALMLPQEITGLGKQKQLVIVEDCPPILARKIRYYSDPTFVDRLKSISPTLAKLGRKLPTEKQLKDVAKSGELAAPVARIDLQAHQALVERSSKAVVIRAAEPTAPVEVVPVVREVTADDVPDFDQLALSDFVVDFSTIQAPAAGELDIEALNRYADALCEQSGVRVKG